MGQMKVIYRVPSFGISILGVRTFTFTPNVISLHSLHRSVPDPNQSYPRHEASVSDFKLSYLMAWYGLSLRSIDYWLWKDVVFFGTVTSTLI